MLTILGYGFFVSRDLSRLMTNDTQQNYFLIRPEIVNIFEVKAKELRTGYIFLHFIVVILCFQVGLILSHFKWFFSIIIKYSDNYITGNILSFDNSMPFDTKNSGPSSFP